MSARPLQSRNGVALQELYNRLKDIDLAIRSLEELERIKATVPTLAVVKQILRDEA